MLVSIEARRDGRTGMETVPFENGPDVQRMAREHSRRTTADVVVVCCATGRVLDTYTNGRRNAAEST